MSKWLQRFIAALLLLTFQPGLPVPIQIQPNENNAPRILQQSVFNLDLIGAAEADEGGCTERCGTSSIILLFLGLLFIPPLMPIVIGIAIIYGLISYVVNG